MQLFGGAWFRRRSDDCFVFACDRYSRFFEDFFQMPEITGQSDHREQPNEVLAVMVFGQKQKTISDHYLCSLLSLHKLLSIVRKKGRLCLL
jgi:hypothetical protein